jgi:Xaa-Pro aminopeptidase
MFMRNVFESRWEKIRDHLEDKKADAFIVTNPCNIAYLTCPRILSGLTKSHPIKFLVIVKNDEPIAITSYMEAGNVRNNCPISQILTFSVMPAADIKADAVKPEEAIKKVMTQKKSATIRFDQPVTDIRGEVDDFVESMRAVKDQHEIECIKKAQNISIKAIKEIKGFLAEGKSELEVANELKCTIMRLGGYAQDPLIASGENSASGHHQPYKRKIRRGDAVFCDFGAFYEGYCADITRTYLIGNVSKEITQAYQAVYESVQAGIDRVEDGVQYSEIDKACNDALEKYGLRRFRWVSGTGHGIGIEVHERPRLAPDSTEIVKEGHVFTIEPGVYIPGKFGVRIEDDILVHKGVHNLTLLEKRIDEVTL